MNYEKKYKEAMLAMQQRVEAGIIEQCYAEAIFPELKVDEDEELRRLLIHVFKTYQNSTRINPDKWENIKIGRILTWLDKQAPPKWDDEDEGNYQDILTHLIMEGNSATLDANRKKWRKLSTWFKSRIPVQNKIDLDRAWEFCVNCIEDCMSRYMESWDDKSRESTYQNFLIYMKGGK